MQIKNVKLENNLVLAPMAGVTDFAFRALCKRYGAGLTTTEMVSARALRYNSKNTFDLLKTHESETPKAVQLFGHDPVDFEFALKCGALDKFDIIDINMGCPAPKIVKNGEGSALLKNIPLAKSIVEACVKSTDKPVTVKMRKSFEDGFEAMELCRAVEEAGASAITIHGRTRPQMYGGKCDLDAVAKIKGLVKIPVFGNGDVEDFESYERMLSTGVDGVMIGRGAMGKPWVFDLNGKHDEIDKLSIILEHIDMLKKEYSENYLNSYMRKHILWYLKDEDHAKDVKLKVVQQKSLSDLVDLIKNFFEVRR